MDYRQENLDFFKQFAPTIYIKMTSNLAEDSPVKVSYEQDKKTFLAQRANVNIYLSSIFDSKREVKNALKNCNKEAGLVVLLGIGNLALIKAIKEHFRQIRRFIIVEPSINIFNCVMQQMSVRDIFTDYPDTDISIVLHEDLSVVSNYYRAFATLYPYDATAFVCSISYAQLFSYDKKSLQDFVYNASLQDIMTINTKEYFRSAWHSNEWKNLAVEAPSIGMLQQAFSQLPVIVVSAGPSLNKNIHLLKEVGNRAIIVTAGSGMRILHNHGIKPHLRFSIEGNSIQDRLFDGLDVNDSPMAFISSIYYKVLRPYKDNAFEFLVCKGDALKEYILKKLAAPYTDTSSGSSISNIAVFLALTLGCKKIILMGQDLCFTDNKNYADGAWASDKENKAIVHQNHDVSTIDLYGNPVYTSSGFLSIKELLELAADWHKGPHFINATEGGLILKGYENKPLSLVLKEDLPQESIDIAKFFQDCLADYKNSPQKIARQQICFVVEQMLKDLQKLVDKVSRISHFTKRAIDNKTVAKIRKQHDQILCDEIYSTIYFGFFGKEEKNLRSALASDDMLKRKNALENYCQAIFDFTNLTKTMAAEYLSGEDKHDLIWQL